jgi:hypothetical protein
LPKVILNSNSFDDLKNEPWKYENLSIGGGRYKDCSSIKLGNKDRLIFKKNIKELIII